MSQRRGGEKRVAPDVKSTYKARSSVTAAQGSRQSGADASRGQRAGLQPTSRRTEASGLGACGFARVTVSDQSGQLPAGVDSRVVGCVAHGSVATGRCGHNEQRLAIAAAVKALLDDGVPACVIRKELGLTWPRYYRILDRLGIKHAKADDDARRREHLGESRPRCFQFTVGYPCNFSVQFEGACVVITPTPFRYEIQEVEL